MQRPPSRLGRIGQDKHLKYNPFRSILATSSWENLNPYHTASETSQMFPSVLPLAHAETRRCLQTPGKQQSLPHDPQDLYGFPQVPSVVPVTRLLQPS